MNIQQILQYCLTKKGTLEEYPFGPETTVIKVGSKIFAIFSKGRVSLKCDPFNADLLRMQYFAVTPGYHLNKEHWNTVLINDTVPDDEIKWMVDHSYDLVSKSLTKAEKESF
jgi:predicted DNA-binding protein (MmcQ/YjbR family)